MPRTRSVQIVTAAALVLLATGCDQGRSITRLEPEFEVTPGEIRFGEVTGGAFATQSVELSNVGQASGEVFHIWLDDNTEGHLTLEWLDGAPDDDAVGLPVEEDESTTINVTFRPPFDDWEMDRFDLEDLLLIEHDAADVAIEVPIFGVGIAPDPVPNLYALPETWDAGTVTYGDCVSQEFEVGNNGFADLEIGAASIAGSGAIHFEIIADTASGNLYPRSSSPGAITVEFCPEADGVHDAELLIPSIAPNDDPDLADGTLVVPLTGRGDGTPAPKGPIPVCGASGTAGPLETVFLDGSGSWDPNGYEPLTYQWSLTPPAGSAAFLTGAGSATPSFSTDLVGDYVATLQVTNTLGIQSVDSCTTTISVAAAEDFRVEMFWTWSGDDMDLHLLRTTSSSPTSDDDCYYANCQGTWAAVDWFSPGRGLEDPTLDIDDIAGTGPENINIDAPQPSTYVVAVHDYPGSSYTSANPTTVNIYLNGSLADTSTWDITGEDGYWYIATISWPSGVITPCSGLGGC